MEYIKRILHSDIKIAPITVLSLEKNISFMISAHSDGNLLELNTGGVADRVDLVSGVTRIVDYKTGTVSETISSITDLFTEDRKKDSDGWLQTLLYCEAYLAANKSVTVRPSVYKIKKLSGGILNDILRLKSDRKNELPVEDYNLVREEFTVWAQRNPCKNIR